MSQIRRLFVTITAVSVLAIPGLAPSAMAATSPAASSAASPALRGEELAGLRAAMQATVDAGATGVIALVDDGDDTTRLAVGAARLDPVRPLLATDQARVGSITKTAISVIALQLVGEGKLRLGDSIERWLPGVVPNGSAITIRMLLSHTSGLFDYTEDPAVLADVMAHPHRQWAPRELIDVATAHPPLFAPGTGWSYSNTGYILIGLVLQKATGESLAELVQQRVVRPLQLKNTYFATSARFNGRYAHGYAPPGLISPGYEDVSGWSPSWAWAAGALVSTAPDLARFYQALLSGRLLSPPLLRQMMTTVRPEPGFGYGLGILTLDTPCGTVWGHDGGIPGYVSWALNNRQGTRSAIALLPTQPDDAIAAAFDGVIAAAVCAMFDRPVPTGMTARGSARLPSLTRRSEAML